MRLTFWPENILLGLAEKCVKKLNWLTGKDNFWLGYAVIVSGHFAFLTVDAHPNKFLAMLVLVTPLSAVVAGAIWILQKLSEHELTNSVKIIEVDFLFLLSRVLMLLNFVSGLFSPITGPGTIFNPAEHVVFGSYAAALYFASVQRPPFKKSQAWESVKNLFACRSLVPVPVKM